MSNQYAACRYCGQAIQICAAELTAAEMEESATLSCNCDEAKAYQETLGEISNAKALVVELFGDSAVEYGFKPLAKEKVIDFLNDVIEMVGFRRIHSATVQIFGGVKAKVSRSASGKIYVERAESAKQKLEADDCIR